MEIMNDLPIVMEKNMQSGFSKFCDVACGRSDNESFFKTNYGPEKLNNTPFTIVTDMNENYRINDIKNDLKRKAEEFVDESFQWKFNPQSEDAPLMRDVEAALVSNDIPFRCSSCLNDVEFQEGIVLRECFHHFCRPCLYQTVQLSQSLDVRCPYIEGNEFCHGHLTEIEIRAIFNYGTRLMNIFHCRTVGCMGWCIINKDNPSKYFQCNVCKHVNCLSCFSIHEGKACRVMMPLFPRDLGGKQLHLISSAPKKMMLCQTAGCNTLCSVTTNDIFFCEVCQYMNCIPCRAMHEGQSCQQFQDDVLRSQKEVKDSMEIQIETIDVDNEVFFCETPICSNWCTPKPQQKLFFCNVCNSVTCIPCQAKHEGLTCNEYNFHKQYGLNSTVELINNEIEKKYRRIKMKRKDEIMGLIRMKRKDETVGPFRMKRKDGIMDPLLMKRKNQISIYIRRKNLDEIIQNEIKEQNEIIQRELNRRREQEEREFQEQLMIQERAEEQQRLQEREKNQQWLHEREKKQQRLQEREIKQKEVITEFLLLLEKKAEELIPNAEPFTCQICFDDIAIGDGVLLQNCLHSFCRVCLVSTIEHSETPAVKCPFVDGTNSCESHLFELEIRLLLNPQQYEKRLQLCLNFAENCASDSFHCKTPDCPGWVILGEGNRFNCEVCNRRNCIPCAAVHEGMTCEEYEAAHPMQDDDQQAKSKAHINELIRKELAMFCPTCKVVLNKISGCDNVKCTMCQTEVCWATKGPRWGPKGKGDISGGCRCNVNGKCHPKCKNCH